METPELALRITSIILLVIGYLVRRFWHGYRRYIDDKAFGDSRACLPMETWIPYKWPLALDILKRQYDALADQRLMSFQSQYFDKLGPNMTFRLLGNRGYFTADPKNIESMLSANFEDWYLGSRRAGLMPLLGEGIFTQDGRPWRHSRGLLRRQFQRIRRLDCDHLQGHVEDLISRLRSASGLVDLQPYFFRFTLTTTTALIFGAPVSALSEEDTNTFEKAFDYASYVSAIRVRLADIEWIWKPSKFKGACTVVKQYASDFVRIALDDMEKNGEKAASERHAFVIDLYRELQDPTLVRDQLIHVLIAGRDTTACLISWTFFLLVRHPDVLKRLREEIELVTGGSPRFDRDKMKQMKYLRCVINECQRLYPQLPTNVRVAARTTTIPSEESPDSKSPVLIPKGTKVGYSVYHMHRLKSLYGDDANEFRPDRWLGSSLDGIGWGFMPFHGGPRTCLGREFALMEASYAITRILQAFPNLRLSPQARTVPLGEEKQDLTVVVMSAEGCKVLLR